MRDSQPQKLCRFDRFAFAIFLIVLAIEVVIAIGFRDRFVRFFLGDLLVVVLIGYFIRAFFAIRLPIVAWGTLIFACCVEVAQYFNVADRLGGRDSLVVQLTIGTTFEWTDLIAYAIGAWLILGIDQIRRRLMT